MNGKWRPPGGGLLTHSSYTTRWDTTRMRRRVVRIALDRFEKRALGVDAAAERWLLEALTLDRLALAIAALGELENEARALERRWSLKRERASYEAERARRQYDAVEPENRLVARSLERVWEDKLRQAEQIDIEYESWRR